MPLGAHPFRQSPGLSSPNLHPLPIWEGPQPGRGLISSPTSWFPAETLSKPLMPGTHRRHRGHCVGCSLASGLFKKVLSAGSSCCSHLVHSPAPKPLTSARRPSLAEREKSSCGTRPSVGSPLISTTVVVSCPCFYQESSLAWLWGAGLRGGPSKSLSVTEWVPVPKGVGVPRNRTGRGRDGPRAAQRRQGGHGWGSVRAWEEGPGHSGTMGQGPHST